MGFYEIDSQKHWTQVVTPHSPQFKHHQKRVGFTASHSIVSVYCSQNRGVISRRTSCCVCCTRPLFDLKGNYLSEVGLGVGDDYLLLEEIVPVGALKRPPDGDKGNVKVVTII